MSEIIVNFLRLEAVKHGKSFEGSVSTLDLKWDKNVDIKIQDSRFKRGHLEHGDLLPNLGPYFSFERENPWFLKFFFIKKEIY